MSKYDTDIDSSSSAVDIGRRQLLKGMSGLAFMLCTEDLLAIDTFSENADAEKSVLTSPWVHIDIAGQITIYNPVAEMGQGSSTALPLIITEELDANWDDVVIEYSPINASVYGHASIAGHMMMLTVGSYAVRSYFTKLRIAGASIRQQLLHNAASFFQVPVAELSTRKSRVYHAASKRSVSYGDIAKFAKLDISLPQPKEHELKSVNDFSLIGKFDAPRRDIPSKVDGSAVYAIDVELPDLQYAVIQRAPVNGSVPESFNRVEVEALPGVTAVVPIGYGIGIVGTSFWAVMKARRSLKVIWSKGALAESFNSSRIFNDYEQVLSNHDAQTTLVHKAGNPDKYLADNPSSHTALYRTDFVYHAQMEPLNAVARVSKDKQSVELWAGTQFASGLKDAVAKLMNIPADNVTLNQQYLGGGFGRRSWHDFSLEAVRLALATNLPIKLIWSREDDLINGAYRPATLQGMQASLDENGKLISWRHRTVGDGPKLLAGGAKIPHYDIENQQIDFSVVPSGLRIKHWRAVAYGPNKFAIESFIDEIAATAGKDSYVFRRELLKDDPRALNVLDEAVAMSPWQDKLPSGRALGLAFSENVGSLTAMVVEISLEAQDSKIKVHRVWAALDAGIIVQPDNAIRQTEGAIIQGLGSTLLESITIKNGAVEQSNFHDYHLMKMTDVPEITIKLVESDRAPGGIGEAALPITAPAVGNAFASLTGKRLRHIPFLPSRIKEVLAS
jgi:isoquinoline 1-oxidoreductase subunit beta